MGPKSRRAENTESTRAALLGVARELFAEKGYADTGTEEIVQRARVTRGALYYHFEDKEGLFRAVHEDLEREVAAKIGESALKDPDPWSQLRTGSLAFLDACLDPAVRQISLLDAPSVLGWETWREIDARYGFGLLQTGLAAAMEAGALERQPVQPLAHLILAALCEAGLVIAHAADPKAARAEMGTTVLRLLDGLRPPRGRAKRRDSHATQAGS